MSRQHRQAFIDGYIWAALEQAYAESEEHWTPEWLAWETTKELVRRSSTFYRQFRPSLEAVSTLRPWNNTPPPLWKTLGELLWCTHNHHDRGFWSEHLGSMGTHLANQAREMGEVRLAFFGGKLALHEVIPAR